VVGDGFATFTPGVSERRSGTTRFQHSGIKNADAQSLTNQTVAASRAYDAFGNVAASSGTMNGPFGYGGLFGYQSDADSGLKLLGHRYYDSSTGRFLTRDPIYSGRNWYAYCENNPLSFADPTGLDKKIEDIIKKNKGKLPPGAGERYRNDPELREQVHREVGRQKRPGKTRNPDLSEEEIIDILNDVLRESSTVPRPRTWWDSVDWGQVGKHVVVGTVIGGAVVLGGLTIVTTGGLGTAGVVVGAGVIVGGILAPKGPPKRGF